MANVTDVSNVAEWFLSKESMTHKKLQKLCFYAYAWTLALLNEKAAGEYSCKLFDSRIEAWVHGPVIPELYYKYNNYGWQEIPKLSADAPMPEFSEDVCDVLNQVWSVYGKLSANELEQISHQEAPWLNARNNISRFASSNSLIKDEDIFKYYNEQANAE